MSILFCDSNSELWHETQEALGIRYISMPYTVDGEEFYYDLGKATDFKSFYEKMKDGAVPKTSALNKQNYLDYFEPCLKAGEDVLYIAFSHQMSATFEQMRLAIDELKTKYPARKITAYDTCSISIGAAQQVLAAQIWHAEGLSDEEIVARLEDVKTHTCTVFTPNDLTYLQRGGRLSKGKAFFGSLFNVKPLLTVNTDGKLDNYAKANGRKKAINGMLQKMAELGLDATKPIFVVHADCEADGDYLIGLIREEFGDNLDIRKQPVGPVIGSHCGPGTLGMSFRSMQPIK